MSQQKRPSDAQLALQRMRVAVYKTFPYFDLAQAALDMAADPSLSGLNRCIKAFRKLAR